MKGLFCYKQEIITKIVSAAWDTESTVPPTQARKCNASGGQYCTAEGGYQKMAVSVPPCGGILKLPLQCGRFSCMPYGRRILKQSHNFTL
jgi:hypothetical protein